jgi:PhoD-like phosphatase
LGPIVGHTDEDSTRIWVRVIGNIENFSLRVKGKGTFEFTSTESTPEFGTAIAIVDGLKSDTTYAYNVTYKRRLIQGSSGSFTTMPSLDSFTKITFVSISCNSENEKGAWEQLNNFIGKAKPRFLLMMGDQLYLDAGIKDVWKDHLSSKANIRRMAMAEKYQQAWSQEPLRTIMKNIPTYMIWDDGDIRNGWGSYAFDSPTLANKYPKGRKMFDKSESYFIDARDLYFHFQASHNPQIQRLDPEFGGRYAQPYYFFCGRLAVLVVDSRGARDLWRSSDPILGEKQWDFIDRFLTGLGSDRNTDSLIIVTPTPIVATSREGFQQGSLGHRTDDIDLFKKGDEENAFNLLHRTSSGWHFWELIYNRYTGESIGYYKIDQLGDVRSQWSHVLSRAEQEKLIRLTTRITSKVQRSVVKRVSFIGGDLHVGGLLEIRLKDLPASVEVLVTSGISTTVGLEAPTVPAFYDESFNIADDIHVNLKLVVRDFNFGVTQVIFGGEPTITNDVIHKGWANYWKLSLP